MLTLIKAVTEYLRAKLESGDWDLEVEEEIALIALASAVTEILGD